MTMDEEHWSLWRRMSLSLLSLFRKSHPTMAPHPTRGHHHHQSPGPPVSLLLIYTYLLAMCLLLLINGRHCMYAPAINRQCDVLETIQGLDGAISFHQLAGAVSRADLSPHAAGCVLVLVVELGAHYHPPTAPRGHRTRWPLRGSYLISSSWDV